ncbi:MAG TPA: adenylate/guanylate cyclase domain-containing protein [Chitinophagaceae bacterium]|nr:adenylate/guanylate cyclase domain-containing protein [Chitinophagaceae bacterium]
MNRATQLKLKQLKVIICGWLIIGFLIAVYDHLVFIANDAYGLSEERSFMFSVALNMGAALTGALLGGSFLVFFVNVRYQDKPYGYTIIAVSISFILIIALIAVIVGIILAPDLTAGSILDTMLRMAPRTLKNIIIWSLVVAITQLLLQVNSKFGQGAFWDIIRGKYNTPREEKRIFMFLDLNSSTTIAEQLRDEAYHALLKDFFADITTPILENKGEIYQYVGDEVVIAWNYEDGKKDLHCLKCFFDMKLHIQKKKEKYLRQYGVIPSFKAGIHCGRVIAGEVGVIKRDITYSGDVLNTTSRILTKCGELNEEIIASEELLSEVSFIKDYITRPLGAIRLKGKTKEVLLNALIPVIR